MLVYCIIHLCFILNLYHTDIKQMVSKNSTALFLDDVEHGDWDGGFVLSSSLEVKQNNKKYFANDADRHHYG